MVLYLHGGGYVIGSPRSHRHLAAAIAGAAGRQRAPARLPPGARAPLPGGGGGRDRRVPLAAGPGHRPRAHRDRGRLRGRRAHGGHAAGPARGAACRCPRAASASRPGWTSPAAAPATRRRRRRIRSCGAPGVEEMAQAYLGATPAADPARLAALRRPARPAPAADPRGQRRGAARRRGPARGAGQGRRRGRDARGLRPHDPRLALVPADARRGADRRRRDRPVRAGDTHDHPHRVLQRPARPRDRRW